MRIKRVKYKEVEKLPEFKFKKEFKADFLGASPAPFIGRVGYPQVNIGVLSPQLLEGAGKYDNPKLWSSAGYTINQIAGMRYELVNSKAKRNVYGAGGAYGGAYGKHEKHKSSRLLEVCQEVGMASKPVELEVNLKGVPRLRLNEGSEVIPFGPSGEVRKIRVTSNPRVDSRVEKVVSDIDLKAEEGVWGLYRKGLDENFLSKLISVGNLGLKRKRKLVPTRWSITATDDILGKKIWKEVRRFPIGDYAAYFGGEWGNYYLVLFFPEVWSFELFEMYLGYKVNPWSSAGNFYSTNYESYGGRKDYAEECAGGYYACRLGVLEKMKEMKRQMGALVLRFITSEYNIPLGVFVCREATRTALKNKPLKFNSKELMIGYAKTFIKNKFGFDLNLLLTKSKLLTNLKQQSKLTKFL